MMRAKFPSGVKISDLDDASSRASISIEQVVTGLAGDSSLLTDLKTNLQLREQVLQWIHNLLVDEGKEGVSVVTTAVPLHP